MSRLFLLTAAALFSLALASCATKPAAAPAGDCKDGSCCAPSAKH